MNKLISSMSHRIEAVVEFKGHKTKYWPKSALLQQSTLFIAFAMTKKVLTPRWGQLYSLSRNFDYCEIVP